MTYICGSARNAYVVMGREGAENEKLGLVWLYRRTHDLPWAHP